MPCIPCGPCGPITFVTEEVDEFEFPVPVAVLDVTFVGVTTMTFDDNELLEVDAVVLFTRTGPFTPDVFVVVALVVEVEPFTTETGPLAPEVPVVSAANECVGAPIAKALMPTSNLSRNSQDFTTLGSLNAQFHSILGLG